MKQWIKWLVLLLVLQTAGAATVPGLSDQNATAQTRALYRNLKKCAGKQILFGSFTPTARGQKGDFDKPYTESDCKTMTGSHPAVFGWDVANISPEFNEVTDDQLGWVTRDEHIIDTYTKGAVCTISWHMKNPVTLKNTKNTEGNPVQKILDPNFETDNGITRARYLAMLDKFAYKANKVWVVDGVKIPILFRPFHENRGNWFWWGAKHCSEEEYKALWLLTHDYLQNHHGIHHFLWVYSPDKSTESVKDYLDRYPGDDVVDVLGFDFYCTPRQTDIPKLADIVGKIAGQKKKVCAATEIGYCQGYQNAPFDDFYMERLLKPILKKRHGGNLSYIATWGNNWRTDPVSWWIPLPENRAKADDFLKFYNHPRTTFLNTIPKMYTD